MTFIDRLAGLVGLRSETPAPSSTTITLASQSRETVLWQGNAAATTIGAVFSAVSIIATAVEQLSIDLERSNVLVDSTAFVARPDPDISRSDWLHEVTTSLALHGNAYLRVWRNAAGHGQVARVLDPLDVHPWIDENGRRRFTWRGTDLTTWEIAHLRYLKLPGRIKGAGPIQAAADELTGHRDLIAATGSWATTSGVPSGILSTDQHLTEEQRTSLLASWNAVPAGRTRLISNGLHYETTRISARDAQFLESRRFSKTEILDMFGIPASLALGIDKGDSQTYANIEQDWLGFVRFRLMRYIREIEECLTGLLPRGQQARVNLEALLRTDAESRMRIHAAAIAAGVYSAAYAREIEHLPATAAPTTPAAS